MQSTLPLLVFLSFSCASNTPSLYAGIDCNHKKFLCHNRKQFYPCIAIGDSKTVTLSELQYCPEGSICDDSSEVECKEPKIVEVISLWRTLSPLTTSAVNGNTPTVETTTILNSQGTTLTKNIEIFTLNTTHDTTVTRISPTTSVFETSTTNNLEDHVIDVSSNLTKSNNSDITKLQGAVSDRYDAEVDKNSTKNGEIIIDKHTRFTFLGNSSFIVSENNVQNQTNVTSIGEGITDYSITTEQIQTQYFQTSTISSLNNDILNTNSNFNAEETIIESTEVNEIGSTTIISFKDETNIKTTEDKSNYNSYLESNEIYSTDNNGSDYVGTTLSTISAINTTNSTFDLEINAHISNLVYTQDSQENVNRSGSTTIQSIDFNYKNEEDIISSAISNNNNNNNISKGSNISNINISSTLDFKDAIRIKDVPVVLNTTLSSIALSSNINDSSYLVRDYKIVNEQVETGINLPILTYHSTGTTTNSFYYQDDNATIITDNVIYDTSDNANNNTKITKDISVSSTERTTPNINLNDDKSDVRTTNNIEVDGKGDTSNVYKLIGTSYGFENIDDRTTLENNVYNVKNSRDFILESTTTLSSTTLTIRVGTTNGDEEHDINNNNETNLNFNSTPLQSVRTTTPKINTNFDFNKNVAGTTQILDKVTNSQENKYEEEILDILTIPYHIEQTTVESNTSFNFDENSGTSSKNIVNNTIRGDGTVNEFFLVDINSNINHYNGGVSNNISTINTGTTDALDFTSTTLSNDKPVRNMGSTVFYFDNIVSNTVDDDKVQNTKINEDNYNELNPYSITITDNEVTSAKFEYFGTTNNVDFNGMNYNINNHSETISDGTFPFKLSTNKITTDTNYNNIQDTYNTDENDQNHIIFDIISADSKSTDFDFEKSDVSTTIDTKIHNKKDNEHNIGETITDIFSATLNSFNVDESDAYNLTAETYGTNENESTKSDSKSTNFDFEKSGVSTTTGTKTHNEKDSEHNIGETVSDIFSATLSSFNVDENDAYNVTAETYGTNENESTKSYSKSTNFDFEKGGVSTTIGTKTHNQKDNEHGTGETITGIFSATLNSFNVDESDAYNLTAETYGTNENESTKSDSKSTNFDFEKSGVSTTTGTKTHNERDSEHNIGETVSDIFSATLSSFNVDENDAYNVTAETYGTNENESTKSYSKSTNFDFEKGGVSTTIGTKTHNQKDNEHGTGETITGIFSATLNSFNVDDNDAYNVTTETYGTNENESTKSDSKSTNFDFEKSGFSTTIDTKTYNQKDNEHGTGETITGIFSATLNSFNVDENDAYNVTAETYGTNENESTKSYSKSTNFDFEKSGVSTTIGTKTHTQKYNEQYIGEIISDIFSATLSSFNVDESDAYNLTAKTYGTNENESTKSDSKNTNFDFEKSGFSTTIDTKTHNQKDNEHNIGETITDIFSATLNSFNIDESDAYNLTAETYGTNENESTKSDSTLFTMANKDNMKESNDKEDKDYISISNENVFQAAFVDNSLLSTASTKSTEMFLSQNVPDIPFEEAISTIFNEDAVEYTPAVNNLLNPVGTNPTEVVLNHDSDMSLESIVFGNDNRQSTFMMNSNEEVLEKYIKEDNEGQSIEVTSKKFEDLVITMRADRNEFGKTGNYFGSVDKEDQFEYKTGTPVELTKFDRENNEDNRLVTSGGGDTITIHDGIDKIKENFSSSGTYYQTTFSENDLTSKESVTTEINHDAIVTQKLSLESVTASMGILEYEQTYGNAKNNEITDGGNQGLKGTTVFSINKVSDGSTIDHKVSRHSNAMNKQTQSIESTSKIIEDITPNPTSFEAVVNLNNTKENSAEEFVCRSAGKFPDPKNYSLCHFCIDIFVKYVHVLMECSKSTQYDDEMKSDTGNTVEYTTSDVTTYCTTTGVFPHPTDCNRYYKCFWRSVHKKFVLWQFRCPPRMKYDAEKKLCVNATLLPHCGGLSEAPPDAKESPFYCSENGRFPAEYNCDRYYECKEKKGAFQMKLKTCSEGKLFDREWGRCRRSDLVFCPYERRDISRNSFEDSGENPED